MKQNNSWAWDLKWRSNWFESERPMIETFNLKLTKNLPIKNRLDGWVWKGRTSENYSVRFAYDLLHSGNVVNWEKLFSDIWKVHTVHIWRIGLTKCRLS